MGFVVITHKAPRQLPIDVTAIAQHDFKSGIEHVARTQLIELRCRACRSTRSI